MLTKMQMAAVFVPAVSVAGVVAVALPGVVATLTAFSELDQAIAGLQAKTKAYLLQFDAYKLGLAGYGEPEVLSGGVILGN